MSKFIKTITIIAILSIIASKGNSQKIVDNYIDEFTGDTIKRTEWKSLNMNKGFSMYFRLNYLNGSYYMQIRMMVGAAKVFSVSKDARFILKLKSGELITLHNMDYVITSKGGGAVGYAGSSGMGAQMSYRLTDKQLKTMQIFEVEKIRIYLSDGYLENSVKQKYAELLKRAAYIIMN